MLANWIRGRSAPVEISWVAASGQAKQENGRRFPILHPFLIAAFPILSLYRQNVHRIPATVLIGPLTLALAGTVIVWLTLRFLTHDAARAGLVTSLLVVGFFGYDGLRNLVDSTWNYLKSFWVMHHTQVPLAIFLVIVGAVGFAAIWLIFRKLRQPTLWTAYLNAFTLILAIMPAVGIVSAKIADAGHAHREAALPELGQGLWAPDIYFIILDGYARSDVMKEIYGFDNRPFLERLERRGFSVAKASTSSYCQTQLSLASTLNATYLDQLLAPGTENLLPLEERIRTNLVQKVLRPRGYQYVTFGTGFSPTENPQSDLYLSPGPSPSVFNQFLLAMTPLAPLASSLWPQAKWHDRYSMSRERTMFILDQLPTIAKIPGPTFTFAHILSPHPPFLFGENGEDVSPRFGSSSQRLVPRAAAFIDAPGYVRNGYRNQAAYLTKRIDEVIGQILQQSPEPPVIILQSDHGAWLHYHHNDVEATDLRERFGTLNAMLIPGRKTINGFTDDIVSVNTFRIVLNNVFGANMPLLDGRSYFSTLDYPLKFTDVTERLHSEQERTRTFSPPKSYIGLIEQF